GCTQAVQIHLSPETGATPEETPATRSRRRATDAAKRVHETGDRDRKAWHSGQPQVFVHRDRTRPLHLIHAGASFHSAPRVAPARAATPPRRAAFGDCALRRRVVAEAGRRVRPPRLRRRPPRPTA